jgi:GTPase SAR1 family protein
MPLSFRNLERWREEFLLQSNPRDPNNFPFVIIGNKIDLDDRRVVSLIFSPIVNWRSVNRFLSVNLIS